MSDAAAGHTGAGGYLERALEVRRIDDQRFSRWLGTSFGLHLVLVGVAALWQVLNPAAPLIPREESIEVQLISLAPDEPGAKRSRRLPDKETFVPTAPPETASSVSVIPREEPRIAPVKPEVREAQSLEEALKKETPAPDPGLSDESRQALTAAIDRQKELQARRDAVAKLTGTAGLKDRTAGGGGSEGAGGGSGMGGNAMSADPEWARALNEAITGVWLVLPTLANRDLRAIVYVTVDTDGNLRDVVIEKSSGESSMDASAVRAVKKVRVLPLPNQAELKTSVLAEGFYLVFNPKGLTQ